MNIWAIIPLATCLVYVILLVLTLTYLKKRTHRVFASYLGVAAAWSFTSVMLHLSTSPEQALFWHEALIIAMIGTLITYYHFIRAYTDKPTGIVAYIGYTLLLILAVLSFSGYVVKSAYVIDGVVYHDTGASLYFLGAISLTFVGAGIVLLIMKYRSSLDPIDRNRTAYLMAGWSILMLFCYSNLTPALYKWPLDIIGSLINAIIIAYAIRRYQLLDIKLVLRKGLIYSSLTALLTVLYLLLLFILQMFLHGWAGYSSLAFAALFALLVAVGLNPLKNLLQKWIDRIFYHQTYDYRQVLLTFSNKISNVLDLRELAQSILEPIVRAMHVKQAALLFTRGGSGDFVTQFVQQATKEKPLTELKLADDNPIVSWLTTEGKVLRRELIDITPQLKGLWETEKNVLNTPGAKLLCPIRSRGNLIGILAVGEKQSESPYSDEEVDLLMTMANEAAIAVENAKMLDSIKSQQVQMEQLLAQRAQAQEEEQKRISVDLHDGVAQWLAAASYRIQTCSELLSGNNNDEARSALAKIESTIDKSLKELRRVVTGLRPPTLDELGLTHALKQSLEELRIDGVACQFSEAGTPTRLPSSMEIAVYRVVQEALTNVRKHANATKVNLRLKFQSDKLLVEVHDNGKGFDLTQTLDSAISVGHIGLLGMKQRADTLGGDIKIKTSKGAGTTITLSFPIQRQAEEE